MFMMCIYRIFVVKQRWLWEFEALNKRSIVNRFKCLNKSLYLFYNLLFNWLVRKLINDRLLHCKYTSFLFIANVSRIFFCFSELSNCNFAERRLKIIFVNINKRWFFNYKCRFAKQLSCVYNT